MTPFQLNPSVQSGFEDATSYDTHRPSYPPAAVTRFLSALNLADPDHPSEAVSSSPTTPSLSTPASTSTSKQTSHTTYSTHGPGGQSHAKILELGAGSGKFTELLLQRPEKYEVLAVEPHGPLRAVLEGKMERWGEEERARCRILGSSVERMFGSDGEDVAAAGDGDARMEAGKPNVAEEGEFDCAVAAQAFHWFATEAALKQIHRALRPGAAFGMIWNVEDYNAPKRWTPRTTWEKKLNDLLWDLEDGQPRFRHDKWKAAFEKPVYSNPLQTIKDTVTGLVNGGDDFPTFSLPLGESEVEWSVWLSPQALWARYATLSQIANLRDAAAVRAKQIFDDALAADDVPYNEQGEVEVHGRTYFAWTSRV